MKRLAIVSAAAVLLPTAAQAQELSVLTFQPDYRGGGVFRAERGGNNLGQCKSVASIFNNSFPPGMWAECAIRDDLEGRWVPVPGPSWMGEAAAKAASRGVQIPEGRTAQ
jgi:hypothetical protein